DRVVAAIEAAEQRTSGEVRVLVGRESAPDPVAAARAHFERLGMTRTAERNGVLIFVAPRSRNFAIVGDSGVNAACGDPFWRELATAMEDHFKRGEFTEGLVLGIGRAGDLLARCFPRLSGDRNELPNRIEEA
ncbi:MAG TPA: TPM domain-containing protein, partial [Opitutaceae bacterium]|nr:TPM domain-containing protein [Opitutaceae bacterium]